MCIGRTLRRREAVALFAPTESARRVFSPTMRRPPTCMAETVNGSPPRRGGAFSSALNQRAESLRPLCLTRIRTSRKRDAPPT